MNCESHPTPSEWMLISLSLPGFGSMAAGVMLVDHSTNRLYARVRNDLPTIDEDTSLILSDLSEELEQQAMEVGAKDFLLRCEDEWSNTFRLSRRHAIRVIDPLRMIQRLFQDEVTFAAPRQRFLFTPEQIDSAKWAIPLSPSVALQAITALRDPDVDLGTIQKILEQDPLIAAHIVSLANSALYGSGNQVNSIATALSRIGTDLATWHIAALSFQKMYSALAFRRVWNHSVEASAIVRRICRQSNLWDEGEATLAALVHDIGRLPLLALKGFDKKSRELELEGNYPAEAERQLCGQSHAEIGAGLLREWHFPDSIVDAVWAHHNAVEGDGVLANILCLTEQLSGSDEDLSPSSMSEILQRLNLSPDILSTNTKPLDADLEGIRFATATA